MKQSTDTLINCGVAPTGDAAGKEQSFPTWSPLGGSIVLFCTALIFAALQRFIWLFEYPTGFAGHAIFHHKLSALFLGYFECALGISKCMDLPWPIVSQQFGLMTLYHALFFLLFGVGPHQALISTAVLGCLCVGIVGLIGYEFRGVMFGYLSVGVALSAPWLITFSRYGDAEHISALLQILSTMYLMLLVWKRNRIFLSVCLGVSLGGSWYLYGTNQLIPIIFALWAPLLFAPIRSRRSLLLFSSFLISFVVVSYPAIERSIRESASLFPVRSTLPSNENYQVLGYDSLLGNIAKATKQLLFNSNDPWYESSEGAFPWFLDLFGLVSLLFILWNLIVNRRLKWIWILFLVSLAIGLLPAVLSSMDTFRRLLIPLIFLLFLIADGLFLSTKKFQWLGHKKILAVLFIALFFSGTFSYSKKVYAIASEGDKLISSLAEAVSMHIDRGERVTVFISEPALIGQIRDYLWFFSFKSLGSKHSPDIISLESRVTFQVIGGQAFAHQNILKWCALNSGATAILPENLALLWLNQNEVTEEKNRTLDYHTYADFLGDTSAVRITCNSTT